MDKKGNIVLGVGHTSFNTENKHYSFMYRSIKIARVIEIARPANVGW